MVEIIHVQKSRRLVTIFTEINSAILRTGSFEVHSKMKGGGLSQ